MRPTIDPFTGQPLFFDDAPFRLEPLHRSNEVASGLAARVHDPAWALTRQWQLGEFMGQDAGSPVVVELKGRSTVISAWRPSLDDSAPWIPYDPRSGPLDELVEAEEPGEPDERARVEGGAHFVRMLHEDGRAAALPAVLESFGFAALAAAGDDDIGLVALLAGAVPDALRLAAAVDAGGLGVPEAEAVAVRWRTWWAGEQPATGPDTFDKHRFEHQASFSVANLVVRAEEYLGDGLDWFSVDVDPIGLAEPSAEPLEFTREAVAAPLRYGGIPADRFWEMEDAQIDLGSTDVSTLDTGRLLLIAFAEVYGNDWFLAPLEVPAGSLTVLERVLVTDTFGDKHLIERAGRENAGWNLFTLTGADDGLLVMPSNRGLSGEILETVLLTRDELANLAWAIEASVTDARGERVDRRDRWLASAPAPRRAGELPAYAVQTIVPDYWLPLIPQRVSAGSIRFDLVALEQPGADSRPLGRLLAPGTWVHEQEVPREGASVTRRPVLGRWFDGSWHAWTRREKAPGRGESSSGLLFDIVRPSEPWP